MTALEELNEHLFGTPDSSKPYISGVELYKKALLERLLIAFNVSSKDELVEFLCETMKKDKTVIEEMVEEMITPKRDV